MAATRRPCSGMRSARRRMRRSLNWAIVALTSSAGQLPCAAEGDTSITRSTSKSNSWHGVVVRVVVGVDVAEVVPVVVKVVPVVVGVVVSHTKLWFTVETNDVAMLVVVTPALAFSLGKIVELPVTSFARVSVRELAFNPNAQTSTSDSSTMLWTREIDRVSTGLSCSSGWSKTPLLSTTKCMGATTPFSRCCDDSTVCCTCFRAMSRFDPVALPSPPEYVTSWRRPVTSSTVCETPRLNCVVASSSNDTAANRTLCKPTYCFKLNTILCAISIALLKAPSEPPDSSSSVDEDASSKKTTSALG